MTRTIALALSVVLFAGCTSFKGFSSQGSFERGLSLFNQGRFEDAIPHFERATRENPDFAEAYFYLARAYVSLSRWRSAIQPLRTAFRLAPRDAQEEIMNLLIDAMFAAALNDFHLGDRLAPPSEQRREEFSGSL